MFKDIITDKKVVLIDDIGELVFSKNIEESEKYELLMTANHLYNAFKEKSFLEARIFFEKMIIFLTAIGEFLLFIFFDKGDFFSEYEIRELKLKFEKIIME